MNPNDALDEMFNQEPSRFVPPTVAQVESPSAMESPEFTNRRLFKENMNSMLMDLYSQQTLVDLLNQFIQDEQSSSTPDKQNQDGNDDALQNICDEICQIMDIDLEELEALSNYCLFALLDEEALPKMQDEHVALMDHLVFLESKRQVA
ncbi:hypothetical protein AKO1_006893, partial [Acrasis kona]